MTTAATAEIHGALEAAVRAYERHENVAPGHYVQSRAVNLNGIHLHLRLAGDRRKFAGVVIPGFDGVRVVKAGDRPICHHRRIPAAVFTMNHRPDRQDTDQTRGAR